MAADPLGGNFNDFFYLSYTEETRQNLQLFNADGNNCLKLMTKQFYGDYEHELSYSYLDSLIYHRQTQKTPVAKAAITPSQYTQTSVKYGIGAGPLRTDRQWFQRYLRSPEEGGMVFGRQVSSGFQRHKLNQAISTLVATLTANSDNFLDLSEDTPASVDADNRISIRALNKAATRWADRRSDIVAYVMDGETYGDLLDSNLQANFQRLFYYEGPNGIAIMQDTEGRTILKTDAPALRTGTGSTERVNVLALTEGAVEILDQGDFWPNFDLRNGFDVGPQATWQAIETTAQKVKGFSWDVTNGGIDPTATALGTGSNWDKVVTNKKDTAGVVIKLNAAA